MAGLGVSVLSMIASIILYLLKRKEFGYFYTISMVSILVIIVLVQRKKERENMLNNHYKPYSRVRMRAFSELLKEYGIDYNDEKKMNMLIEQAEVAKNRRSVTLGIKSPINATFTYVCSPVITTILNRIVDSIEIDELLGQAIQGGLIFLTIILLLIAMISIGTSIFGGDSDKYEDLKYDLQQMMIFGDTTGAQV